MVQKRKEKLGKASIGLEKSSKRAAAPKFTGERKRAPKKRKVSKLEHKKTADITKNIERVLANRVAHHGGVLRLIKPEGDTTSFEKSGPELGELQKKLRAGMNARRKAQADAHQAMIASELRKQQAAEERLRRELEAKAEAELLAQIKPKRPPLPRFIPQLDDDDVAGPFFVEETKQLLGLDDESTQKADSSSTAQNKPEDQEPEKLRASQKMHGRKAGFKGVTSKKAASILEEAF